LSGGCCAQNFLEVWMPEITVSRANDTTFRVTVAESGSRTTHDVTVTPDDVARYAPGVSPEDLVRASFVFLLERERKESILSRFELPVIERYFPEYPRVIGTLTGGTGNRV
jgi:hypothetical protein